jgi:hypothetical protein
LRPSLWRVGREDLRPLLLIALLPLVIALPLLLGFLNADPALLNAGLVIDPRWPAADQGGFPMAQPAAEASRGAPIIDGNNGITVQALGARAALEILHGRAPWWNAYSGVGMPLAAEYQPAAFFPLTFLLLLPQGALIEHLLLQILAGWGAYALLRQLSLGRLAALTGGVLFAFDGTLAWFGNAAALPLPFLPWLLLGIERARAKAELGSRGGWRLFAVATALDLLGGFPEAAYLNGLMALSWAGLRLFQILPGKRFAFAWRVALGGVVGVALAAPQIFAFLQSLPISVATFHDPKALANAHLDPINIVPSFIAPYAFGPIYKYASIWPALFAAWGSLGGYVTAAILVLAAYGFMARRSPLAWLLLGWMVLALGKSFGVQPAVFIFNLLPGVTEAVIDRYIQPTWILALVILAATAIDDLVQSGAPRRGPLIGAALVAVLALGGSLVFGAYYWNSWHAVAGLRTWTALSLLWAALSAAFCGAFLAWQRRWTAPILAVLVMVESGFMFAVPTLSNLPGDTKLDIPAVEFLRRNIDLSRFYTLGPFQSNYGAYYGVASINNNYVPNPKLLLDWEMAHLDGVTDAYSLFFRNLGGALGPVHVLSRYVPALEWAGVKYVVAAPHEVPPAATMRRVYADAAMDIFELSNPAPYFEVVSGKCRVAAPNRRHADVDCATPATLVRREMFYPGWTARVNGTETTISLYKDLFQMIGLPQGKSAVEFRYAPPHIVWMWLAALVGIGTLVLSAFLEFRAGRFSKPVSALTS